MALWRLIRSAPGWLFPLAVGLLVLFLPEFGLGFALSRQVQLACILALVVSGLNLSLGYAGELALGQAAMYAAGAYTAGLMSIAGYTDIVLQLTASGLVALAVGIVTGIPGLRLGSWSLAMTSFFLVLLVPDIIAVFGDTTGGRNGLSGIEPATLFGEVVDADRFYMVVVIVAILWFAVLRNLVASRHGIAFRTLKQSPVLASSVGISVFRMKLLGYAIGAFPAGLAGALFANIDLYVSPEAFGFTFATAVLAACILGGATSVYGAAVGAAIMQLGPNQSSEFQQYALVFYGGFLILGGVLLSGGLAKVATQATARLDRAAGLTGRGTRARPAGTDRPAMDPMPGQVLVVDGISKAFGGNQALDNASLRAEPGSITALIGPNGSGKTTMLNMICGFYRPDSGRILIGDTEVQGRAPERVAGCGVARTFQTPDIPDGVTVREAVASGRYSTDRVSMFSTVLRLPRHHRVRAADIAEAERALDVVGLSHLRDETATALPLGMRRLLEV
ncbi:ATP-binding cassette domain-containing protein, partial [Rhodococcus sp. NPDC057014]|uniref:ABC transporter permease subunit n=1 Tax=Rhodococcus sp. NPDC057014 TaxID=3346000 RepID=UPI0036334674